MRGRIIMILRESKDLLGTKLLLIFFSVIPLGVIVGASEILFGFALQNFLVAFGFLAPLDSKFQSLPLATRPLLLVILLTCVQAGFNFFANITPGIAYEAFNSRIRRFIAISSFESDRDQAAFSVTEAGHILSNLTPKVGVFFSSCTQVCSACVMIATFVVGMLFLSVPLTLLSLLAIVFFGLPMIILKNSFQRFSANVYARSSQFTHSLLRNLRNIYFLRIVGTCQRELDALLSLDKDILRNYFHYNIGITSNSSWPIFSGVILVVSIVLINHRWHYLQAGLLLPFVYLLTRLSPAISRIATAVGQMQFNFPFLMELFHTYDARSTHNIDDHFDRYGRQEMPEQLVAENLIVGRKMALLSGIDFKVQRGEFLLISGKSGKGKTTLLMTLIGIVPKLSGGLRWNEIPIEEIDITFLKQYIGYSGADPFLFDDSVEENLLYGVFDKEKARKNIAKALAIAQCSFVYTLSGGLRHKLTEGGEGISAGQKQRLSLARALLREPRVLLLDEATANIDEKTEEEFFVQLRAGYPEIMILAVSHRDSLRKFASHVLAL